MSEIRKYITLIEGYENSIVEDVQEDKVKRMQANTIVDALLSELKSNGLTNFKMKLDTSMTFTIPSKDLHIHELIAIRPFDISIVTRTIPKSTLATYNPANNEIVIYLPKLISKEALEREAEIEELIKPDTAFMYKINEFFNQKRKETLFHEVIHLIDDLIGGWLKKAKHKKGDRGGFADHSNRHVEISTRTAEILYGFEQSILNKQRDKHKIREFSVSFKNWYDYVLVNTVLHDILPVLESNNKKRLLARLFQYWNEFIKGETTLNKALSAVDSPDDSDSTKNVNRYTIDVVDGGGDVTINILDDDNTALGYISATYSEDGIFSDELVDEISNRESLRINSELYIDDMSVSGDIMATLLEAIVKFSLKHGIDIITESVFDGYPDSTNIAKEYGFQQSSEGGYYRLN